MKVNRITHNIITKLENRVYRNAEYIEKFFDEIPDIYVSSKRNISKNWLRRLFKF